MFIPVFKKFSKSGNIEGKTSEITFNSPVKPKVQHFLAGSQCHEKNLKETTGQTLSKLESQFLCTGLISVV